MIFTPEEIEQLERSPDAMRLLADYHSQQGTMADAMDYKDAARFHERRRRELLGIASLLIDHVQIEEVGQ